MNIVNPAKSPYHPGAAYMELQFYAPGYPGFSTDNYGAHHQYGHLLKVAYTGSGGTATYSYEDYQNKLVSNPCPR